MNLSAISRAKSRVHPERLRKLSGMNLSMANYLGKKYLDEVLYGIDESRLVYPE